MEDQTQDRIADHELDSRRGEFDQPSTPSRPTQPGDDPIDDPGELILHQTGDQVVFVPEVLIERGTTDAGTVGDLTERDVGGADLRKQGAGCVEDLPPGLRLVRLDVLGLDPGHVPRLPRSCHAFGRLVLAAHRARWLRRLVASDR